MLDGGTTYTFVVYSINSALSNLPAITPLAPIRTLANSQIALAGTQDYMYYRQNLTVTGNTTNRLNIILKHRFSQITTTINAGQTGYNITAVTSGLLPSNTTALANLSTGDFTRGVATAPSPVSFSNLNAQLVSSTPTIISAPAGINISYQIASIQIGTITETNLTPFTTLQVTPGVKYNLTLNIVPQDELITHAGIPAARINGKIWARHNLGVNTSANPDVASFNALIGNFYQWGRSAVVATGSTGTGAIAGWSTVSNLAGNRWNLGTEALPVKNTAFDPCPLGFRVPTLAEQTSLIANTIPTNLGDFSTVDPLNTAKVLTSARNNSVKLTFPLAGNRLWEDGRRQVRAVSGYFWSSNSQPGDNTRHFGFHQGQVNIGSSSQRWGMNVRCIAE